MLIKFLISSVGALLALAVWLQFDPSLFEKKSLASTKDKNPPRRSQILPAIQPPKPIPPQKLSVVMNDPSLHKKWGLEKTQAMEAWQLSTGSRDIVVAVIDTGIDVMHKDLRENLWKNPGETGKDRYGKDKATNGKDDDGNGYIDDVHGWNFVHNSHDLTDNHGHGTHIAGIIGAQGGNNFGGIGIAPKVSLMVLKYFDPRSPGDNLTNTIKAIKYANSKNVQIINYSGGGTQFSKPEYDAVNESQQKGILFVAAAGNESSNSDFHKYFPADYEIDSIISVTAVNPNLKVLRSSNYGTHTVDLAAPGEDIYSTLPKNAFGPMTGTSQATAFVSGAAAVLMAHNRGFDNRAVKKYLLRTGDNLPWLKSKTGTSKQLNMFKALTMFDQGVGANGVVAENAGDSVEKSARAPSGKPTGSSLRKFGRDLLEKVESSSDEAPSKDM